MTKTLIGIILLILAASLSIGGDCDGDEAAELRLIKTFQGTGDVETASFQVSGEEGKAIEFEVRWTADEATPPFSWALHFSSVNTEMIECNAYGVREGTEEIKFYHPNPFSTTATFVFDVLAIDECNWSIEVWQ